MVEAGAVRVEDRVTASSKICSACFQCCVSTNLETALSRSKLMLLVEDWRLT